MKKFVLAAMLLMSLKCWSQDSAAVKPAMVEQYCEVFMVPTGGLFELFKKNMDVDYGHEAKASKDNRIKDAAGKYKTFNSTADALNYMGKQGWTMVNVFVTLQKGSTDNTTYLFKKLVPLASLAQ